MNRMSIDYASFIVPAISGAVGIGVAYGAMRTTMKEWKERQNKMDEKLEEQVGQLRCDRYREQCRNEIQDALGEIKREMVVNRNWVGEKFEDIARFMGRMNGKFNKKGGETSYE
jgi:hypothetical protein